MYEEYTPRGLHVITLHRQAGSAEQIREMMESRGCNYPVAMGGGGAYQTRGIPHAWLVGVDGLIAWEGNPGNVSQLDDAIEAQLSQIRFPGLGRLNVHEDVARAAQSFVTGQLGDARERAQEVLDDERAEDQAKDDAQFVIDRVNTRVNGWLEEAEAAEQDRRYLEAQRIYERIMDTFGRRDTEYEHADERLDAFREREIRDEIRAWEDLEQLLARIEEMPPEGQAVMLQRYIENRRYEGTRALEEAESLRARLPE